MSIITIHSGKAVFGGLCLSSFENRTVFVSDMVPGERAEVEIISERAGSFFGRPVRILDPSPDRRVPFCPYRLTDAGRQCGGCDWQHIACERQLLLKKEIFSDCLRRIGKIAEDFEIDLFSSPDRGYRHRAQFKIDHPKRRIGFFCRESHDVVPIDACPVLTEPLNRFIESVNRQFGSPPENAAEIKAIAGDRANVASSPVIPGISLAETQISADGLVFEVNGGGFFQQNRFLLSTMGTWVDVGFSGDRCIDLFGGGGFFSVFLAGRFRRGILVERDAAMAAVATRNFALNGIDHFAAETAPAEQFFSGRRSPIAPGDCVVVDPPRIGLPPLVRKGLAAVQPRQILYFSCDPATQARDLHFLLTHGNYRIRHAALFDLYPHTHHIETGVLLAIKN